MAALARAKSSLMMLSAACPKLLLANNVSDKATHAPGGSQRAETFDGLVFPLSARDGLPHLATRPRADVEHNTLPHMTFTGEVDWDPRALDFNVHDDHRNPGWPN